MTPTLVDQVGATNRVGGTARWLPKTRPELARSRLPLAQAALANCHLCEHRCGVNRLTGERGLCKAGTRARVFSAQVEVADELELIPTFAIALSGCDLRCAFCITGEASWNPRAGEDFFPETLAAAAAAALANGARTIMILGGEPTIHLPTVLEIVAALPEEASLVWKTNAHATAEARALLDGLFDVWLADYKFGNDNCAMRLARAADYTRIVQENLRWMAEGQDLRHGIYEPSAEFRNHESVSPFSPLTPALSPLRGEGVSKNTGNGLSAHRRDCAIPSWKDSGEANAEKELAERQADGRAPSPLNGERAGVRGETVPQAPLRRGSAVASRYSELIVRHLLLPGHIECCWRPLAAWLAAELAGVKVSLRAEYWPAWQASRHGEMRRPLSEIESRQARNIAREFALNLIE